jgi:hypothetical protein
VARGLGQLVLKQANPDTFLAHFRAAVRGVTAWGRRFRPATLTWILPLASGDIRFLLVASGAAADRSIQTPTSQSATSTAQRF